MNNTNKFLTVCTASTALFVSPWALVCAGAAYATWKHLDKQEARRRSILESSEPVISTVNFVEPDRFVQRMKKHWVDELHNVPSEALSKTWFQLAEYFNLHISNHTNKALSSKWHVLCPPTGSGKTEGMVVYNSMLSELSDAVHPGVIIVTRLIQDCNAIAERINSFGVRPTAIAYHSESNGKLDDLKKYPVVVITHRAYEIAMDFLGHEGKREQTWPYFHAWNGATRKLVIIDESLDIVKHYEVSLSGLRQTLDAISSLQNIYPSEMRTLRVVEHMLNIPSSGDPKETLVDLTKVREKFSIDLTVIIKSLKSIRFDHQLRVDNIDECDRLCRMHEERLKSLHYILSSPWCYYAPKLDDHTLNTARLLVSDSIKGAIILDATARTNITYELHKDIEIVLPPEGSRSYSNFTLHVSKGHKVGKGFMSDHKNTDQECFNLVYNLADNLRTNSVFIICHKSVEEALGAFVIKSWHVGHWGRIDGSNAWRDCDTAIVFGLPYLPSTWTANVFMALQGIQSTEWLRAEGKRPFGRHSDIRKSLAQSQLSTCIIQGINRIRSRKVVDDQGNCPPSNGYLLLPAGPFADGLLDDIKTAMPGIVLKEWTYGVEEFNPSSVEEDDPFQPRVYDVGIDGEIFGVA